MIDKNQSNKQWEEDKKGRDDVFKEKNWECSKTKGHNSSDCSGWTGIQHITYEKDLYQNLSWCNYGTYQRERF